MERVLGHICRNRLPIGYADTVQQREAIGRALIETLARLHAIDPGDVGLAEFGRPAGFMERQLRRWSEQWQRSKTVDLPALDALRDELVRTLPRQQSAAIVHGDYRLDNTILHPTEPGKIVAVLDWEMSTLGDPFADLGALLAYWSEADDDEVLIAARMVPPVTAASGFPTREQIVGSYARDHRVRYVGSRLVPRVRLFQARGRLPGNRRPRGRRRDARLGVRRRPSAGRATDPRWTACADA